MSEQKNWYDDDTESDQNNKSGNAGNDPGRYGASGGDNNAYGYYYNAPVDPPGTNSRFGGAAFGCGIASLALIMTGIFSICVGALGVLFASLSRRRGGKYPLRARSGMVMSMIGLVLGALITVYSVVTVLQNPQAFYNELESTYKTLYGEDFDMEQFQNLFGGTVIVEGESL